MKKWGFVFPFAIVLSLFLSESSFAQNFPRDFAPVIKKTSPSVVTIQRSIPVLDEAASESPKSPLDVLPENSPFRKFFEKSAPTAEKKEKKKKEAEKIVVGGGSGFFISGNGYIVTNRHVIDGDLELTMLNVSGEEIPVEIVGSDPCADIALLKTKTNGPFPFAEFADSSTVEPGNWTIAIGNPEMLANTATVGIVSALHREIQSMIEACKIPEFSTVYIQTDASINRGNSGGPLFNLDGKVIGINTMIFSRSGGSVGLGFAIPSNTVKFVVEELKTHGRVRRGWMGIQLTKISDNMPASVREHKGKGTFVDKVLKGGPAAKAGVKEGDVLLSFGEKETKIPKDLYAALMSSKIGETVILRIMRGNTIKELRMVIEERRN